MSQFNHTASAIARLAAVTAPTVSKYAEQGLVEHVVSTNGTRLFKPEAAKVVRRLVDASFARRGIRLPQ